MFVAEQTLKQGRGKIAKETLDPLRANVCSLENLEAREREDG